MREWRRRGRGDRKGVYRARKEKKGKEKRKIENKCVYVKEDKGRRKEEKETERKKR